MSGACTHVHVHTEADTRELSVRELRWLVSGLFMDMWSWGKFFFILLKVSIVSAEGFPNFTPACLGIEKEPRRATAGLSLSTSKATFNSADQIVFPTAAASLQLHPDRRERSAPGGGRLRESQLCWVERKRMSGRLTGYVPVRRSPHHYLFLFFVASQIDFWLGAIQAAPPLLGNESPGFVRGHTWAFLFKSNFTMWQPCMTECQGSEGGRYCCTVCFCLLPITWPTFIVIRDAPIPMAVSVRVPRLSALLVLECTHDHFVKFVFVLKMKLMTVTTVLENTSVEKI